MENIDELSRHELLTLKQIRLTGRTADRAMALQLLNDDMIIVSQEGCLQLTAKGRQMLVRGSTALWDMAS